jgi:hypothetical protein
MKHKSCRFAVQCVALFAFCIVVLQCRILAAEKLFESGSLGPTGYTYPDPIGHLPWDAHVISPNVYCGVLFELDKPATISRIGGHFMRRSDFGTDFFGAIIELTGPDDFPDSSDFSTPDVRGVTRLTIPTASAEVFGDISIGLEDGWYALVFASGYFGADGRGSSLCTGTVYGSPTYISWTPTGPGIGWSYSSSWAQGQHLVVEGQFVPEPASHVLWVAGVVSYVARLRRRPRYA